MTDEDAIERRLAAVERALTAGREDPGHPDASVTADAATAVVDGADTTATTDPALAGRVEALEADATGLHRRVADLDAAVQALRGYVGSVRHVNRAVERRAEAALAAAEQAGTGGSEAGREPTAHEDTADRD